MLIQLTGRMRVDGPRGSADAADFPGRQGRIVFASLALTGQPLSRDTLADRVWDARLPKAWERDLSAVVSKLRTLLGRVGIGGPELITTVSTAYHLRLPPVAETDVARAGRLVSEAEAAVGAGDNARAVALADAIAAIATRPFLPGEDAVWIEEVRAGLRQAHHRGLAAAAGAQVRLGHAGEAVRLAESAVALEPLRESGYRLLMRIHLDLGDRAPAVRAYERCRRLLADELGLDPAPETRDLYLAVLRDGTPDAVPATAGPPRRPAPPEIRYARSGLVNVAYQVIGDGPIDLVLVPGWISNLELLWEEPRLAEFLRRLAAMSRLILFDKRGTGLSDPVPIDAPPDLETRMDDIRAVLDATGSPGAVLLGFSEGGTLSLMYAASHPERTTGLMLWGTWARQVPTADFPWGLTREEGLHRFVRPLQATGTVDLRWFAPSAVGDPAVERWFRRFARQSASPGMAIALLKANAGMDIRATLATVRVPTLVLHRAEDVMVDVHQGRYLAAHIAGARYAELPGRDHWPWIGDMDAVLTEVAVFLDDVRTGRAVRSPGGEDGEDVLATVAAIRPGAGDAGTAAVARRLHDHRGALINADGTELTARFDGPGRAVRFAATFAAHGAGAGVHVGEIRLGGAVATGMAVDTARGLATLAGPGDVLVTRTVTDLVAGSGLRFTEHGTAGVRGVPGHRPLFRLSRPVAARGC